MSRLGFHDVEVDGTRTDIVVDGGEVAAVGPGAARTCTDVVEGEGRAVIPGLWDHHTHLLSSAAAASSIDVAVDLAAALRAADVDRQRGEWIRATGYHESVSGPLDRDALDAIVPDRAVRVQHRSGQLWVLNSEACRAVDLDDGLAGDRADRAGVERDAAGRATGRIFGHDPWLRARIGHDQLDLATIGRRLASAGVVGVTDMTPSDDPTAWGLLADAHLPQHVVATGSPALIGHPAPAPLRLGPVKVYLADHGLPPFHDLVTSIRSARAADRSVAFHCVTRTSLALALAALDDAGGAAPGDRIEHGAVVPPDLGAAIAARSLTVVTQPSFITEHGDRYRQEVDPDDLPHLYPCATLLERGVRVAGSTDGPFGDPDPWRAIGAAVERRTRSGAVLGAGERVDPGRALRLFLGSPDDPGGAPRRIEDGAAADLCLLDGPLDDILGARGAGGAGGDRERHRTATSDLRAPGDRPVVLTMVAGRVVHGRV